PYLTPPNPVDAASHVPSSVPHLTLRNEHLVIAAVESTILEDDAATLRRLAAQPNVEFVFHDRIVSAHRLRLQNVPPASAGVNIAGQSPSPSTPIGKLPTHGPILTTPPSLQPTPPP